MEGTIVEENNTEKNDIDSSSVTIGWCLYLVGMFTGIFYLVAYIWALIKKGSAKDEFEKTHYRKMISMFNVSSIITIIALGFLVFYFYQAFNSMNEYNYTNQVSTDITISYLIGLFLMLTVYVWNFVRIIKGLLKSSNKKSYI